MLDIRPLVLSLPLIHSRSRCMRRQACAYLIPEKLSAVLAIELLCEELDKTC